MRSEEQMMNLILTFAREHEDIRAVVMTGSRTNPAATPDHFQDYDITYLAEDLEQYRQNSRIPDYFGEIMILQNPDDMGESVSRYTRYAYLMQFMDGNRIDLTFRSLSDLEPILADSLALVLLDKDGRLALPPPALDSYLPSRPTSKQFNDCCNEFWWVNPYVAKGLYRDQLPYAKGMLDGPLRTQVMRMLTWYVGITTNFQVTLGFAGKYLKKYLSPELWDFFERTYSDARPDNIWESLFAMGELFRTTARACANEFRFDYPEREDAVVSAFIRQIRVQAKF